MIRAIMIEDDGELADLLIEFLRKNDIEVTNYQSPDLGLLSLDMHEFDIAILDLSLPDMDGVEVCKIITEKYNIPLIISSARSNINDKIQTLELGADDYLPKPYDPMELVARIHTILRRYSANYNSKIQKNKPEETNFIINEEAMEILYKGTALKLTHAEFEILRFFIKKQGIVVSREEIINNVDSINYESSEKSIDVIISRIRTKIEEDTKNPKHIISIRGVGYKFCD